MIVIAGSTKTLHFSQEQHGLGHRLEQRSRSMQILIRLANDFIISLNLAFSSRWAGGHIQDLVRWTSNLNYCHLSWQK